MSRFPPEFLKRTFASTSTIAKQYPSVVSLNAHGAAWLTSTAEGAQVWQYLPWSGSSPLQALAILQSYLAPSRHSKMTVVLAPSLVRHWVQSPPAQVASLHELRSVAAIRCTQLFGSQSTKDALESGWTVSANWDATQAFVCAAIPTAWMQAGEKYSDNLNIGNDQLAHILHRCRRNIPRDGWLAVVVAHSLYLLHLQDHHVLNLRTLRMSATIDPADLQQAAIEEWAREMLRTQSRFNVLHWLCAMPQSQTGINLPSIKLIPYSTAAPVPSPPNALSQEFTKGVDLQHVHEVLLSTWSAHHNLAGAH